ISLGHRSLGRLTDLVLCSPHGSNRGRDQLPWGMAASIKSRNGASRASNFEEDGIPRLGPLIAPETASTPPCAGGKCGVCTSFPPPDMLRSETTKGTRNERFAKKVEKRSQTPCDGVSADSKPAPLWRISRGQSTDGRGPDRRVQKLF